MSAAAGKKKVLVCLSIHDPGSLFFLDCCCCCCPPQQQHSKRFSLSMLHRFSKFNDVFPRKIFSYLNCHLSAVLICLAGDGDAMGRKEARGRGQGFILGWLIILRDTNRPGQKKRRPRQCDGAFCVVWVCLCFGRNRGRESVPKRTLSFYVCLDVFDPQNQG
jgi:hypothetical protein